MTIQIRPSTGGRGGARRVRCPIGREPEAWLLNTDGWRRRSAAIGAPAGT